MDDLAYWAMAPSYIYRSKLTKDEKIIVPVLMAFMDEYGYWDYDVDTLALASGMSTDEVEDAVEGLKKRDFFTLGKDGRCTVTWAYRP